MGYWWCFYLVGDVGGVVMCFEWIEELDEVL